jgi:O-antigen/teichoic acid export membrane protein
MVGIVVSNALAYGFHFVAGRMLGPEEYGVFGSLMALFFLVSLPAFSFGTAVTKFTSDYHAANKFGEIGLLRRKAQDIVLVFFAGLMLFTAIFYGSVVDFLKIDQVGSVVVLAATILFSLLLAVNRGVLQGMKKFHALSWNSIVEAAARLVFLGVLFFFGYGVNGALLAYGLAFLLAFLLVFRVIKDTREVVGVLERIELTSIYWFTLRVLVANIVLHGIINVPTLLVKHYFTSAFTGQWTAALNIARMSLFVTGAISLVVFPEIVAEKDPVSRQKIYNKALLLVLLLSSAVAAVFWAIPAWIIQVLYGTAYKGAVPILEWMGIAMIFIGFLQLYANYWLAKLP